MTINIALSNDKLVTLTIPVNYIIVLIIIIVLTSYFIHAYLYHTSANKSVVHLKTHSGSPHDAVSVCLVNSLGVKTHTQSTHANWLPEQKQF